MRYIPFIRKEFVEHQRKELSKRAVNLRHQEFNEVKLMKHEKSLCKLIFLPFHLGNALPTVNGVRVERVNGKTNNFNILWSYPSLPSYNAESKNWEYAVFYGKTGEELTGKSESILQLLQSVRI